MSGPAADSKPDLTIAIATYDRPAGLAETLRSCLAQQNRLGLTLELVVVDNHPAGAGRAVVEALSAEAPFPLRYATDLTRNMSILRNRLFSESRGRLVAFIDDDETAAPDWLDELAGTLRRSGMDIAVGPRLARFLEGPPSYDPTGASFERDLRLPDGAEIFLTRSSGKPNYGLGTGNSLFDLARCFPDGEAPMSEAFGNAGGEDAELFVRLHRQGRRIVWAAGAKVTETVLPHRTQIAYRMLRIRRETQHYVTIYLSGARRPRLAWLELMAKGIVQYAAGFIWAAVTLEGASKRRIRGRTLMAFGMGKLSWTQPVGYIQEPS